MPRREERSRLGDFTSANGRQKPEAGVGVSLSLVYDVWGLRHTLMDVQTERGSSDGAGTATWVVTVSTSTLRDGSVQEAEKTLSRREGDNASQVHRQPLFQVARQEIPAVIEVGYVKHSCDHVGDKHC